MQIYVPIRGIRALTHVETTLEQTDRIDRRAFTSAVNNFKTGRFVVK